MQTILETWEHASPALEWQLCGRSHLICRQTHLPRTTLSHAQSLHRLVFTCCQSVQSHIDLHAPAWLKIEAHLDVSPQNTSSSARHVVHLAEPDTTHGHSFLTFFRTSEQPCEDQRPQQRGALTETPPLVGYEPNWIVEDRDYRHFTGDGQFSEHEDLRVRPLSFHQSIIASTYDSAESIATLPESDFEDEQLRALLASPLFLQEREASAERSQVYHSERENLMSKFISRSDKYRETCRSVFKPE